MMTDRSLRDHWTRRTSLQEHTHAHTRKADTTPHFANFECLFFLSYLGPTKAEKGPAGEGGGGGGGATILWLS